MERLLNTLAEDCLLAQRAWGFPVFPGVELTHLPPFAIAETAALARRAGAVVVVVHGETPVEPVEEGTNLAAVRCTDVDILAHPGFLTDEAADLAARNGVFLELSARKGHSLTNGHVARIAQRAGALLLVDSDAHAPEDLLTERLAHATARGAGLEDNFIRVVLEDNPRQLVKRLAARWPTPAPPR